METVVTPDRMERTNDVRVEFSEGVLQVKFQMPFDGYKSLCQHFPFPTISTSFTMHEPTTPSPCSSAPDPFLRSHLRVRVMVPPIHEISSQNEGHGSKSQHPRPENNPSNRALFDGIIGQDKTCSSVWMMHGLFQTPNPTFGWIQSAATQTPLWFIFVPPRLLALLRTHCANVVSMSPAVEVGL